MKHDYGYRKERAGFEVWALAPATGDRRQLIDTVRSECAARRLIAKLRTAAAKE